MFCSSDDNPNGPSVADLFLGDGVSTGGRFCDRRQFDVPFTHELKLAGNYPLPFGFDVGAVLQSNGNAIFSQNNAIGNSLGQVQSILQGRMMRLGFQMKF